MAGKISPHVASNNSLESDSRSESFTRTTTQSQHRESDKESMRNLWKEFFDTLDTDKSHTAGEMTAGNEIVFKQNTENKKNVQKERQSEHIARPDVLAGIDYRAEIVHGSERKANQENRELLHHVQEVQAEIKRLISSYKALEIEFRDVTMSQPTAVGVYHTNFLDFVLAAVRTARIRIEDSASWLGAMKVKLGQQGVPYAQSNERSIATQAG